MVRYNLLRIFDATQITHHERESISYLDHVNKI